MTLAKWRTLMIWRWLFSCTHTSSQAQLAQWFSIVKQSPDSSKYSFVDHYEQYAQVTEAEVGASNKWYTSHYDQIPNTWFLQNLKLTQEHLSTNAEYGLVTKINDAYFNYSIEQGVGPLFFKLMLDILQNNSEEAVAYLVITVIGLKFTDFDSEETRLWVSFVVMLVGAVTWKQSVASMASLPHDFADTLLKVYQTSLVPSFNAQYPYGAVFLCQSR